MKKLYFTLLSFLFLIQSVFAQIQNLPVIINALRNKKTEVEFFQKQVKKNERSLTKNDYAKLSQGLAECERLYSLGKAKGLHIEASPQYPDWQRQIKAYIHFKTKEHLPTLYEKEKELFARLEQHKLLEAITVMVELENAVLQIYQDVLPITEKYYTDTLNDLKPRLAYYQNLHRLNIEIEISYTQKDLSSKKVQELTTKVNEWERLAGKSSAVLQNMLLNTKCQLNESVYHKIKVCREEYTKIPKDLNSLEIYIKCLEDNLSGTYQIQCREQYSMRAIEEELANVKSEASKLREERAVEQERTREAQKIAEIKEKERRRKEYEDCLRRREASKYISGYITSTLCCDGTRSKSSGRGTCSHHGGVCGTVNDPIYTYTVECGY